MPTILHLCTRYRRGGSEQRLRDLVAAVDADHRLLLGGESDIDRAIADFPDSTIDLWPWFRRRVEPLADIASIAALVSRLRREPVDLLVTHQSKAGLTGRLAGRITGTPVIHSLSMASTGPGYGPIGGPLFAAAERLAAPWADCYLVVGDDLAGRAAANGVSPDRCRVVRSTVAMPRPGLDRSDHRRQLPPLADLAEVADRPWLVAVGALEPRKNPARLPSILATVRERLGGGLDPVLLVAGSGPERAAIEAEAERLGLTESVRLLGHIDWAPELIAAADCQVLLSRAEGLPQVLVQGAAADTPFVSYDVDGVSELLALGARGRVTAIGDDAAVADGVAHWLATTSERATAGADLSSWEPSRVAEGYRAACEAVLGLERVPS